MSNDFDLTLDDAPAYRIHRVSRLLRVDLVRILAPHDLSPEQFFVLFRLRMKDGRVQGDLTDPALDDRANITRIVGGLVKRGLVQRRRDPEDGRVRRIWLTDTGRSTFDELVPMIRSTRATLFAGLTEDQLASLHGILDVVEQNLTA